MEVQVPHTVTDTTHWGQKNLFPIELPLKLLWERYWTTSLPPREGGNLGVHLSSVDEWRTQHFLWCSVGVEQLFSENIVLLRTPFLGSLVTKQASIRAFPFPQQCGHFRIACFFSSKLGYTRQEENPDNSATYPSLGSKFPGPPVFFLHLQSFVYFTYNIQVFHCA